MLILFWSVLLAVLVPCAVTAETPIPDPTKAGESFIDHFARLDRNRWYISNGWANGPHQNCTFSSVNVAVEGTANLSLTDHPTSDRLFTCAELQTKDFFVYGTYEVRMRPAAGIGVVSAFFSFTGTPHAAGRPHDEIDFEFLGKDPGSVFLNYFVGGPRHERTIRFEFDAAATMHNYAFQWTPDAIRWFVDGRLVREETKSTDRPIPERAQKIYISIWNGIGWDQEAWLGSFKYPGHPLVATYEYIAFTAMRAPCQFPASIVCGQTREGR
jgi:endo-1,3-1,4-beta-glycanase ExoK